MSRGKFWTLFILGAVAIGLIVGLKYINNNDLVQQVQNNTISLKVNSKQLNITKEAVVNVSNKIDTELVPNQAIIAKGLGDIGNIVVSKLNRVQSNISQVRNATNLIDDIKLQVDKIANESIPVNLNLSYLNVTR